MSEDFYLGRIFDLSSGETTSETLDYDPDDLTTHAVIVGMTGSGKTGLCLDLMEEAALNEVPALMIDLKGDITNAVLHFPNLAPSDFAPWVNADQAQREGKTVEAVAASTAELWKNGLASWDIGSERIQALSDSVQFAIYTPGSEAGLPVSILSSLRAPEIPWAGNEESLRERIGSTVTALLGLIGMQDIDPVRSREHILLANIFEHAWSAGRDLDLGELIMQTQTPPFEKLGVFDVNRFFPEDDRFDLAILLNNILAAPSFQSWISGEPLDIQTLLYTPDGRPRHTIFYLAHLTEEERMFFVTLLFGATESWMRSQAGTNSLRALLYFDEIFGYLPPISNPPSKEPMLRMLKQARAFGVGLVLATQNPVDVDYKGLSNAGTWFIGKLGTEQDKARLLDGLESAMSGVGLDRREYDRMISGLGKRVFLLRNVHEKAPVLFQTRWAMNYLAGPMTRNQIPALNALAGAAAGEAPPAVASAPSQPTAVAAAPAPTAASEATPAIGSQTKPAVPGRTAEFFLPHNLTLSEAARAALRDPADFGPHQSFIYRPHLLAQAEIRLLNRKYNLDLELQRSALIVEPDRRGVIRWETAVDPQTPPLDQRDFERTPLPEATFGPLEAPLNDDSTLRSIEKDFVDWLYRETEINVRSNPTLKLFTGPDVSEEEFEQRCAAAAKEAALAEVEKISAQYDRKIAALQKKLSKEERELEEDEAELAQRKREEGLKHVENIFGLFTGKRRSLSTSMTKRRMTAKAKADVEESQAEIAEMKQELDELEDAKAEAIDDVTERWMDIAEEREEIPVHPYKKDIGVTLFGVAWQPYFLVEENGRWVEIPAFALPS